MAQHFHYRIARFLQMMHEANGPLTGAAICKMLEIKPRTLRSDLSRYKNTLLEHGIQLDSRPGTGYQLKILDAEKYHRLMSTIAAAQHRQHCVVPIYHPARVRYIMRYLLSANDYVRLDILAEEIYISRSTLNGCMKDVRKELAVFKLDLQAKKGAGIKIVGAELNIRQAMAKYFHYDDSYPQPDERKGNSVRNDLARILRATLEEGAFTLTDTGFQNLIIHLEIALLRISYCDDDTPLPAHYSMLQEREEYRLSELLIAHIECAFAVVFPQIERYFVAIHLAGKRALSADTDPISPDVVQLFDKINLKIFDDLGLDLSGDFELFHLLSLHLIPMMDRLHWELKVNNPLLEEIKQESSQAFEMAVLAGNIIQQETGLRVNEEEIGYLAIHFALAIERQGRASQRYNLLLVCASGMGSSRLLLYRLRQRFSHSIRELKIIQLYALANFDLTDVDVILSTVEVPFATSVPVLRVNYFFDDRDANRVSQWLRQDKLRQHNEINRYFRPELFFTDLQATERYSLLSEFCERVARHISVDPQFSSWVIEREQLSATSFGHGIAFPHPLHPCSNQTFVAVAPLKKAVRWDNHEVRYIFMLNIGKGERMSLDRLYESLINFMDGGKTLAALDSNPTFATLMSLISR